MDGDAFKDLARSILNVLRLDIDENNMLICSNSRSKVAARCKLELKMRLGEAFMYIWNCERFLVEELPFVSEFAVWDNHDDPLPTRCIQNPFNGCKSLEEIEIKADLLKED